LSYSPLLDDAVRMGRPVEIGQRGGVEEKVAAHTTSINEMFGSINARR